MRQQYRMPRWAMQAARHLGTTVVISLSVVALIMLAFVLTHVPSAGVSAIAVHAAHAVAAVTPESNCISLPVPC